MPKTTLTVDEHAAAMTDITLDALANLPAEERSARIRAFARRAKKLDGRENMTRRNKR